MKLIDKHRISCSEGPSLCLSPRLSPSTWTPITARPLGTNTWPRTTLEPFWRFRLPLETGEAAGWSWLLCCHGHTSTFSFLFCSPPRYSRTVTSEWWTSCTASSFDSAATHLTTSSLVWCCKTLNENLGKAIDRRWTLCSHKSKERNLKTAKLLQGLSQLSLKSRDIYAKQEEEKYSQHDSRWALIGLSFPARHRSSATLFAKFTFQFRLSGEKKQFNDLFINSLPYLNIICVQRKQKWKHQLFTAVAEERAAWEGTAFSGPVMGGGAQGVRKGWLGSACTRNGC